MRKVWIEAALNGAWSRALQPGIPDTMDAIISEGIACAKAGAAIVHMHAHDGGGPQTFDWQVYVRIIEGIRNQVDAVIYPSDQARSEADGVLPAGMVTYPAAFSTETSRKTSPMPPPSSTKLNFLSGLNQDTRPHAIM